MIFQMTRCPARVAAPSLGGRVVVGARRSLFVAAPPPRFGAGGVVRPPPRKEAQWLLLLRRCRRNLSVLPAAQAVVLRNNNPESENPPSSVVAAAAMAMVLAVGGSCALCTPPPPPPRRPAFEEHLDASEEGEDEGRRPLTRNFIAEAASKALPSVVNITTTFNLGLGLQQGSAGSGFIIRDDGLVVTNAHVVARGSKPAGDIAVTLDDGRRFRGRLVSFDRLSDVALVRIDDARHLPVAKMGSSSRLRAGDFVVALGSPLNLSNSVTSGIVSAVARPGSEIGAGGRGEYVQTDAAINVGNSGGPLIDLDGRVIGINTMKAARADGISFAIPIDTAMQVVRRLVKHGRVARPYIGIKMVTRHDPANGGHPVVIVADVASDSPAAEAGLEAGDVVVAFNNARVRSIADVLAQIGFDDNQRIPVLVRRAGTQNAIQLTIKAQPATIDQHNANAPG